MTIREREASFGETSTGGQDSNKKGPFLIHRDNIPKEGGVKNNKKYNVVDK